MYRHEDAGGSRFDQQWQAHARAPALISTSMVVWRATEQLAQHTRAPDGAHRRVRDPAHFAPLFGRKPRGQVMLHREVLLELGDVARTYLSALRARSRIDMWQGLDCIEITAADLYATHDHVQDAAIIVDRSHLLTARVAVRCRVDLLASDAHPFNCRTPSGRNDTTSLLYGAEPWCEVTTSLRGVRNARLRTPHHVPTVGLGNVYRFDENWRLIPIDTCGAGVAPLTGSEPRLWVGFAHDGCDNVLNSVFQGAVRFDLSRLADIPHKLVTRPVLRLETGGQSRSRSAT
jgi:hypothetical protein